MTVLILYSNKMAGKGRTFCESTKSCPKGFLKSVFMPESALTTFWQAGPENGLFPKLQLRKDKIREESLRRCMQ